MARNTPTRRIPRMQTAVAHPAKLHPVEDVVDYLERYAKDRPTEMALWCLAVGFVLGWRLKPW